MKLVPGIFVLCAAALTCSFGVARAQKVVPLGSNGGAGHASQTATAAGKPKIDIDASLRKDPNATVVWIAYGVWLGLHHPNLAQEQAAGLRVYVPTFDVDYSARTNQINVWNQIKAKDPTVINVYMVQIEAINAAGFLREYVWEYYRQPGWQAPPDLSLARFDAWRKQHLPDLRAETHAHLAM